MAKEHFTRTAVPPEILTGLKGAGDADIPPPKPKPEAKAPPAIEQPMTVKNVEGQKGKKRR